MTQQPPQSVRLPGDVSAALDELAEQRGLTRHAAIIAVLRAGLLANPPGVVTITKPRTDAGIDAIVAQELAGASMVDTAKPTPTRTFTKAKRIVGYDGDHKPIYR